MFCPQCGKESDSDQRYCRSCGANLKVIAKAVSLGEAVARSDRGPMPKIKEMIGSIKIDAVTDEISRALDHVNQEIVRGAACKKKSIGDWREFAIANKESAGARRQRYLASGMASLFSGVGLMVFLHYFAAAIVLKLPPDAVARIPFELEPVIKMIWMVGIIPALSGIGRITGAVLAGTGPKQEALIEKSPDVPATFFNKDTAQVSSVTEGTTISLGNKISARHTS